MALTDGADNQSARNDASEAVTIIRNTPNLNVALITIGDGINMSMCQRFLDAAKDAGNKSMLVKATNTEQIMKAFADVAAAMAGAAEAL